jgi:Ankyrin repeats (3 copies)
LGSGHYIVIDRKEARALLSTEGVPAWMVQKSEESLLTTPLILAAQRNQPAIVKLLLAAGADVEQQNEKGSTAMTVARDSGLAEVEQLLAK